MDGRAPREDKVRQQLILVSRAAMSSTIVIGLAQGGTVTILYGLMGIAIINLCVALSIGEVASAYPSAGGQVRSSSNTTKRFSDVWVNRHVQYIWSALLAKTPRARKVLSFIVGWVTVFEWLTVTASVVIILAQVTFAIVQLLHPDFVIAPWQVYLVYLAVNILSVTWNIFGLRKMPWIGKVFCESARVNHSTHTLTPAILIQSTSLRLSSSAYLWPWSPKLPHTNRIHLSGGLTLTRLAGRVHLWSCQRALSTLATSMQVSTAQYTSRRRS